MAIRENARLRHFHIGFTFQDRRLPFGTNPTIATRVVSNIILHDT